MDFLEKFTIEIVNAEELNVKKVCNLWEILKILKKI